MQKEPRTIRVSPSLIIALLALLVASSGVAYALGAGEVKTRNIANGAVTTAKLHANAVTSAKVKKHSLHMSDLGGNGSGKKILSAATVTGGTCNRINIHLWLPVPPGVLGSMAFGYLTDADGTTAVLSNSGHVVPTIVSPTTQGGAEAQVLVCATSGDETIPDGAILHYTIAKP